MGKISDENLNGLIRQYFKKSSNFTTIKDAEVEDIEVNLNQRPKKRFNYENLIFIIDKSLFKNN